MVVNLSKFNKSKNSKSENLTFIPNIKAMRKPMFQISSARKAFNYLKQVFIEAQILQHFDLESFIQIETDVLGYSIAGVFGQSSLNWVTLDGSILLKSNFAQ